MNNELSMIPRSLVRLVVLAALVGSLLQVQRSQGLPGTPCAGLGRVKGMGSAPQAQLYQNHFIPRFESACGSEAFGKVQYDPLGDANAVFNAIHRDEGIGPDPYLIFASDLPMTNVEKSTAEQDVYHPLNPRSGTLINHFPVYVFGVAIGYNLGSCETGAKLKLSSRTLSLIYSGIITTWNDPQLVLGSLTDPNDDNPSLANCNLTINAARRDDEAASTIVLKDYLSQGNPSFTAYKVKELNRVWPQTLPIGCRAIGDAGMSTCLSTPGTIGYVLYQEAHDKSYPLAALQNVSGSFVTPGTESSGAKSGWPDQCLPAAQSAPLGSFSLGGSGTQGDWSRTSLTATAQGYPICGFGYWLAYSRSVYAFSGSPSYGYGITATHVRTIFDFVNESVRDSTQEDLKLQHVSPIPPNVRTVVRSGLNNLSTV